MAKKTAERTTNLPIVEFLYFKGTISHIIELPNFSNQTVPLPLASPLCISTAHSPHYRLAIEDASFRIFLEIDQW